MGCQKAIAKTIVNKGADYLLAVKGNQKKLYDALKQAFSGVDSESLKIEKGHGRIEAREYHVLDASELAGDFSQWTGLKSMGMAVRYQHDDEKPSLEYRYYISSAPLTTVQFAKAVRGHRGIESSLHWVLDTAMKEDNCQIFRGNGAENLARLRHIAKNMIKADKSRKASVRQKTRMALMEKSYLESVFLAGCNEMVNK